MLNPNKKFADSNGIDLPILKVYLAGKIEGKNIDKCLEWRRRIVDYYADYKGKGAYPVSFFDALNSKESDSVDEKGLSSAIPKNLIYDKDILSVENADVVIANMSDYMEESLKDILVIDEQTITDIKGKDVCKAYGRLRDAILDRRSNWGTQFEVSVAMYLGKPTILIAENERQKEMLEKHPFMGRASVIVGSVEELLENKWVNILYKSISSATY